MWYRTGIKQKPTPTTYNWRQVAEFLDIKGVGRNKLMEMLKKAGVLNIYGLPYEKYVDAGYFDFRARPMYNKSYVAATVLGKRGLDFIGETVNEYLNQEKKYE